MFPSETVKTIVAQASTCHPFVRCRTNHNAGPALAPGPEQTSFAGNGTFSGEGSASSATPVGTTFTLTSNSTFTSADLGDSEVRSTGGVFNGTGTCVGNAAFTVTDAAPGVIEGDGTANGTGTFTFSNGTTVKGTDESFTENDLTFSDGTGTFNGVDTTLNGTGRVSGNNFTCFGSGTYQGSGEVDGAGEAAGAFSMTGVGYFSGTGVFQGTGTCSGTATSFISDDRQAAISAGFPDAITIDHPSATPGPTTAASA
ncbi:hypothetical protein WJX73_001204 [Symbiochloris irregularis]|uniref:Transferrin-binding protein B C-lobe/N-lobe beta barrel domain-containing protein n=1 Tax=Symbiochloris irregularis TaxID=706552 RepID=A0AAW1NMR3_9CHLO